MAGHICPECGVAFARRYSRDRHVFNMHSNHNLVHVCRFCGGIFKSVRKLKRHRLEHRPDTDFVLVASAHNGKCVRFRKGYRYKMRTLEESFHADRQQMIQLLDYEWLVRGSMKTSIIFHVEFIRVDSLEEKKYEMCLRDKASLISQAGDVEKLLHSSLRHAQLRCDDFVSHGGYYKCYTTCYMLHLLFCYRNWMAIGRGETYHFFPHSMYN